MTQEHKWWHYESSGSFQTPELHFTQNRKCLCASCNSATWQTCVLNLTTDIQFNCIQITRICFEILTIYEKQIVNFTRIESTFCCNINGQHYIMIPRSENRSQAVRCSDPTPNQYTKAYVSLNQWCDITMLLIKWIYSSIAHDTVL